MTRENRPHVACTPTRLPPATRPRMTSENRPRTVRPRTVSAMTSENRPRTLNASGGRDALVNYRRNHFFLVLQRMRLLGTTNANNSTIIAKMATNSSTRGMPADATPRESPVFDAALTESKIAGSAS